MVRKTELLEPHDEQSFDFQWKANDVVTRFPYLHFPRKKMPLTL